MKAEAPIGCSGCLPAAGCGGMRASRPTAAWVVAAVRFGGAFRKVCRGGPWPARETLRHRGVPGTISGLRAGPAARLASETRLRAQCKHRPLQRFVVTRGRGFPGFPGWPPHFPGWPRHSPSSVGVDSISARGRLCRRGVRRDEGIPPYGRLGGCGRPGLASRVRKVCRGGIYPSRGPSGAAGFPGRCEHRPLQRFVETGGRGFPVGRGIRRRP